MIVLSIIPVDLSVSFAASGFSPALKSFDKSFGVSEEVGTLGLSVYVAGLAIGPMINAPISEVRFFTRHRDVLGLKRRKLRLKHSISAAV